MAQLKDLIVTGATRLVGNAYAGTVQLTTLNAPTVAGGTTYGPGTNGYVLKSNGSSVYWGSDNNSVTGVKGNAESSYRTGQVNLTPANIGALALTGGTLTGSLQIKALGKDNFISVPDKHFASADGTKVGAIKITFPVSWTATMMSMKVDIYNYNNDNAITYTIGGYNYTGSGGSWTNCSAQCSGTGDKSNLKVRFAHDGTKCCIIIGEINTSWSYPKVVIRDILLGHSGTTLANWIVGWDIGWITELPTNIDVIKENTNITSNYPTKTGVGASGTWGINITGNAATATSATTATTATNAYSLLAFSANEISIGATATPADATNSVIWINYRSGYGGSTSDAATQITEYDFGNRKGNTTGVTLKAANFSGNAATATKLAAARTISLTGSVTGSGSFDGSGNLSIATTTNHNHKTLTVGNKTYNGSSDVTIEIADLGLASTTTFLGLTSTNLSNGSTTNPVTITVGPTTGSVTATNGGVVMEASSGEEYIWSGNKWNLMGLASSWALANHIHGNITNAGTITSDTAKASGQHLVITDSNNKICRSAITLGTATNTYLRNDGSWATLGNAATATKLATARNINGTAFDGSADITTANWGTARTITIGNTGKSVNGSANVSWSHAEIGATVSNTWANGTTAGPTLSTTVNGVTGTAVAVPSASETQSGVVTTDSQHFRGVKSFDIIHLFAKNASGGATPYPGDISYYNAAGNQVAEYWYNCGDATNVTGGRFWWREYSPNSTATNTSSGFYENYCLPAVTTGRTENVNYEILTEKNYSTILDNRYVNVTGDTMTGDLTMNNCSIIIRNENYTKGTAPSSAQYRYSAIFMDNHTGTAAANRMAMIRQGYGTTGTNALNFFIYNPAAGSTDQKYMYIQCDASGNYKAGSTAPFYGAVWNDYAEYRETKEEIEPGRCIRETGKGDLVLTDARMQEGCEIVSDTFGFAIGENEKCKTPTATTGRVLAYLYEDRELAKPGRPVCSGPNGTVSLMTNEEAREYPWCIIGTVSEIPNYEIWHAGSQDGNEKEEIKVNGRIWIRIR